MLLTKIQVRQVTGKRNDTDAVEFQKILKSEFYFITKWSIKLIKSYHGGLDNEWFSQER